MVTKRELIMEIEREDRRLGHFWKAGNYRYGVHYYYGKLEKYNKKWLENLLNRLKKEKG